MWVLGVRWGRGNLLAPQHPPSSPSSSSSAWLQPRLPPNTSSASTGNRCRGVTPRAEAGQGRCPSRHRPLPPVPTKPAARPCLSVLVRGGELVALSLQEPLTCQECVANSPRVCPTPRKRIVHLLNEPTHLNSPARPVTVCGPYQVLRPWQCMGPRSWVLRSSAVIDK